VQFPTIIDFYREGQQTARVSVDSVEYNAEVPEKLFAKPVNIKEVK
jgi:ERCC4-type nuclease